MQNKGLKQRIPLIVTDEANCWITRGPQLIRTPGISPGAVIGHTFRNTVFGHLHGSAGSFPVLQHMLRITSFICFGQIIRNTIHCVRIPFRSGTRRRHGAVWMDTAGVSAATSLETSPLFLHLYCSSADQPSSRAFRVRPRYWFLKKLLELRLHRHTEKRAIKDITLLYRSNFIDNVIY